MRNSKRPASPRQQEVHVEDAVAALRARVAGEVRFDPGARAAYSTDASNYREVPLGVVLPRNLAASRGRPMADVLLAVCVAAATLAVAVATFALAVGLWVAATGEQLVHCPRCHRYHFVDESGRREGGCPEGAMHHAVHVAGHWLHRVHLHRHRAAGAAHR